MKVTVDLVYPEPKPNRKIDIEIRDGLIGARLMNAIDKAVAKAAPVPDDWTRWNLVSAE
jgi:hypothetical protein